MRSIPSPNFGGTRGKVYWIIVHTAEGALTVDALGNYFAKPSAQVSSHAGADDRETVQYVDYSQVAWTARSANPNSDQIELCAFAAWTRGQWLTHGGMLEQCAQWIADRCRARGIPPVKIGPADVAARKAGVIGHIDITNGLHDGTHTDPGPNFPWDVVMARVQDILEGDDMPTADDVWNAVLPVKYGLGPATAKDWVEDTRKVVGDINDQLKGTAPGSLNADLRGELAIHRADLDDIKATLATILAKLG